MEPNRIKYPPGHWICSDDKEKALQAYLEQQSKTYSKIKNSFVRELLGNLKDKDFLDYGCGGGMFLLYGAGEGAASVVGVDAEERVLETAKYFMEKEELKDRCDFIHSEYISCFSEEKKFDVILMKDVIEHVEEDELLLRKVRELLKPGGFLVLSTQNSFSLNYLIEGTWQSMFRNNKAWCGWDPTHIRFYNPGILKEKFKKAGLKPVEWRSAYIIPYKLPPLPWTGKAYTRFDFLGVIDKIFGKIFPFNLTGWNITVKGILND